MLKIFIRKPQTVHAFQFTKELQNTLIALGKKDDENPIDVRLVDIPNAEAEWNWHIQQLYIKKSDDYWQSINVGDWILKENVDDEIIYYRLTDYDFKNTFSEGEEC